MKILSGDVNTVVTMKGEREIEKTESVWIDTLFQSTPLCKGRLVENVKRILASVKSRIAHVGLVTCFLFAHLILEASALHVLVCCFI